MPATTIKQTQEKEFFGSSSLIPVASKCNFTILRLESKAVINVAKRVASWTKIYHLRKVQIAHVGNDHWFEVTGCPDGKFLDAQKGNGGYAFTSIKDTRDNLIYRVDLGRELAIGEELVLTLNFCTAAMEQENKLIDISSTWPFFQSMLFRYDQGYSVQCDVLQFTVEVAGGNITGAWPRALCVTCEKTIVQFKKVNLRPYEVLTPLVYIERGSRRKALIAQGIGTFLLGIGASYVAGLMQ